MTGTSLIATMASKYQMDPVQFARTVRATVMPSKHSEEQFAAFMMVAHQYGLNPITREIYAFPARNGGITPVVSIDGWINLVNSHPQLDGFEFDYGPDNKDGNPISCTCMMWRKDRGHPTIVTEFLSEVYRNTDPWNQHTRRMLRHKAFKECARLAFGFAIADEDEVRDVGRSVNRIEAEIAPTSTIEALDSFADGEVDTSGEAGVVASPDGAADAAGAQQTATASAPETNDPRPEIVERLFRLAAEPVDAQAGLESLDIAATMLRDMYPDHRDFLKLAVGTVAKVIRSELAADGARKYLEGIIR